MCAPTRRALLAGSAVLPMVAAAPSPAVSPDAALLELGAEQRRLDAKLRPLNQAFWRTPIEDMAELHRLSDLSTPLADRMDAMAEQMEGMPAATLQGWAAKV